MTVVSTNEKLKTLRVSNGMTLKKVAEMTGFSKWTIINWESGKRSPKVSDLEVYLKKAFDVQSSDFFANPTQSPAGAQGDKPTQAAV